MNELVPFVDELGQPAPFPALEPLTDAECRELGFPFWSPAEETDAARASLARILAAGPPADISR